MVEKNNKDDQKMTYEELSIERKKLQDEGKMSSQITTAGWQTLKNRYLWNGSSLRETYKRMASVSRHLKGKVDDETYEYLSRRFYEILDDIDLAASSPTYNIGTPRGLPVSCSGGVVLDSIDGFYSFRREVAILTKHQFGTSGYLGDIRPRGSKISSGGKATGIVPVLNGIANDMREVTQGTLRRGSFGAYIPIEHDDFEEVIQSVQSDPEDKNIGINYSNDSIRRVLSNNENDEIFSRWQKHMKLRSVFGKGYFFLPEKKHKHQPVMYKPTRQDDIIVKYDELVATVNNKQYKEKYIKACDLLDKFKNEGKAKILSETKTILDIFGYEVYVEDNIKYIKFEVERNLYAKSSNLCVKGDTEIHISYNGIESKIQIEDFVHNWNSGLYSKGVKVLSENKEFKEITNAGKTGKVKKMIRITTPCNKVLECTYDHLIKTANRGYVKAIDLVETDELIF